MAPSVFLGQTRRIASGSSSHAMMRNVFRNETVRLAALFLFFLAISVLLYANAVHGTFVMDDGFFSERGDLHQWPALLQVWLQPYLPMNALAGMYRPLPMFTFALNFLLFGSSTVSFHLTSILLNGCCCLLVFLLVRRLFHNTPLAFFTSFLFAFFPIHTEAVDYIKARDELLSTFFILLSWLCYLSAGEGATRKRYVFLALSACSFLAATLSKEFAVIAPALFIFVSMIRRGMPRPRSLSVTAAPYALAAGICLLMRLAALGPFAFSTQENLLFAQNPLGFADVTTRMCTAFVLALIAIGKTIIPVNLSASYGYNHVPLIDSMLVSWQPLAGLALLLILTVFVIVRRTRVTALGIGAFITLVTYLPFSKFFFAKKIDMFGERWLYLTSVGLALMGGYVFFELWKRQKVLGVALFIAMLAAYAAVIVPRNLDWLSEKTLFESIIRTAPDAVQGYTGMAKIDLNEQDFAAAKRDITAGLRITEYHPPLLDMLGLFALEENNLTLAYQSFDAASRLAPDDDDSFIFLALLYAKQGHYDKSIATLMLNARYDLNLPDVRFLLSVDYEKLGHRDLAAQYIDWDDGGNASWRFFVLPHMGSVADRWNFVDAFH